MRFHCSPKSNKPVRCWLSVGCLLLLTSLLLSPTPLLAQEEPAAPDATTLPQEEPVIPDATTLPQEEPVIPDATTLTQEEPAAPGVTTWYVDDNAGGGIDPAPEAERHGGMQHFALRHALDNAAPRKPPRQSHRTILHSRTPPVGCSRRRK